MVHIVSPVRSSGRNDGGPCTLTSVWRRCAGKSWVVVYVIGMICNTQLVSPNGIFALELSNT